MSRPPSERPSRAIALVAPPWPPYTRPSIQIGALKAFVRSRFPEARVAAKADALDSDWRDMAAVFEDARRTLAGL